MAVYFYVHDLRASGVVRNALTYARRIACDHPTTVIAGYGDGHFAREAAAGGFTLVTLGQSQGRFARLTAAICLRRWLRDRPTGVLVSFGNHGHSAAFLGARGLAHRRIYRISNEVARDDGLRGRIRQGWMKALCRDAVRLILVGGALERNALFADPVGEGRAVAIANGVDIDRARRLAAEPAPHPWLGEGIPVVLGIGRLRPQKNFELLIAAVARARRTRRLRLVILGGGSAAERARLATLATEVGLGEDVLLAGETDNVFAWLARAAVFALPSRWEGSSMALLEALAVGTPVVASRLAGDAAMVLDEGRHGHLFDGDSADALAAALLAQCGPDRIAPGDRALAYSQTATAERYAEVIAAALPPARKTG